MNERKMLAEFIEEARAKRPVMDVYLAKALDYLGELAEENETLRGALRSMRVIKDAEIAKAQNEMQERCAQEAETFILGDDIADAIRELK